MLIRDVSLKEKRTHGDVDIKVVNDHDWESNNNL